MVLKRTFIQTNKVCINVLFSFLKLLENFEFLISWIRANECEGHILLMWKGGEFYGVIF